MGASCLHAPNLMVDACRRWIESGQIALSEAAVRNDIAERQTIAAEYLSDLDVETHANGYHVWAHLPEPWRPLEFVRAAEERGVAIAPAETFTIGREPAPFAVRLSLTAPRNHGDLRQALGIVRGLLDAGHARAVAVV